jgi:hypothetical protein
MPCHTTTKKVLILNMIILKCLLSCYKDEKNILGYLIKYLYLHHSRGPAKYARIQKLLEISFVKKAVRTMWNWSCLVVEWNLALSNTSQTEKK